ncbi:hypothetical protein Pd630_LPD03674 [Rhodococcus opacus PD630]|nr:hypothetical protein Pd630_LPD03674 [Rhodococcus opacus PD630]
MTSSEAYAGALTLRDRLPVIRVRSCPRNSSGPYNLDVLVLDAGCSERELEDALIGRPTHFLSERGGLPSSDASRRGPYQPPDAEDISDGSTS